MHMKTSTAHSYLQAMGIDVWASKKDPQPATNTQDVVNISATDDSIKQMSWDDLKAAVDVCKRCPLYKTRTQTVFGVGNRQADLLIVGEAPGANEDRQGEPFVGRAGKLLNAMIHSLNLTREEVYIANVVKSRPPENRDPTPEEVRACIPYLERQIELIKPKLILTVGRIAAQHMLNTAVTMGELRGRLFHYGAEKIPMIATYHPAYLLRSPREKRKAWEDMQRVMQIIK
jgi:uracil-DNA glycosylase family 4